jgi:Fe2+ or Zn2+ uptake regulation protein
METTYPNPIVEIVDKIIKTGAFEEFLNEEEIEVKYLKDSLSDLLLPKFIAGDELILSLEEIYDAINIASANSILNSLKDKGLIDSIEDEGEEKFFLTQEGHKYCLENNNIVKKND